MLVVKVELPGGQGFIDDTIEVSSMRDFSMGEAGNAILNTYRKTALGQKLFFEENYKIIISSIKLRVSLQK